MTAKCHHLHIGSRDLGVNYVIPTYQGLTTLGKVTNEKDMGATIDCKLNFIDHIVQKVNLADRNLGIIFRTFIYRQCDISQLVQIIGKTAFRVCNTDMVSTLQKKIK